MKTFIEIRCSQCNSNYRVDKTKLPNGINKLRCTKCSNIIVLSSGNATSRYSKEINCYIEYKTKHKLASNIELDVKRVLILEKYLISCHKSVSAAATQDINNFFKLITNKLNEAQLEGMHNTIEELYEILKEKNIININPYIPKDELDSLLEGDIFSNVTENGNQNILAKDNFDRSENKLIETIKSNICYVGRKPSLLNQIGNLAFLYPNKWRLLSFEFNGNYIELSLGDGSVHQLFPNQFEAKIDQDAYDRRQITVKKRDGVKFKFFEPLMIYKENEFDEIIKILDAKDSNVNKFVRPLSKIMRMLKGGHYFGKS